MNEIAHHFHPAEKSVAILPFNELKDMASSDWVELTTAEGEVYYHNEKTDATSWENPASSWVELSTEVRLYIKLRRCELCAMISLVRDRSYFYGPGWRDVLPQ